MNAAAAIIGPMVCEDEGPIPILNRYASSELSQIITNGQPFFTDPQYKLYLGAQQAFQSRVGTTFFAVVATDPAKAVGSLSLRTLFPSLQSVAVLGGFVEKRIASDVTVAVNVVLWPNAVGLNASSGIRCRRLCAHAGPGAGTR